MITASKSRIKRTIPLIIVVCILSIPAQAQYGGGDGTAEDPYLIYTAEQMNTIGTEPNDWDKHFKLMADIDLSNYTGTDFNIIGNGWDNRFRGVFDGNGHTISNFTYVSPDSNRIGLFGYVWGAEIKDLGLIDPNVDVGSGPFAGLLIGQSIEGTISGCFVQDGTISGGEMIGGLVGYNSGTVINCYATVTVTGLQQLGGLVGYNVGGIISACYSAGSVSGATSIGGLAGQNGNYYSGREGVSISGFIDNCYSKCDVNGVTEVGGLVGYNHVGNITRCYSLGGVVGIEQTGGLVGEDNARITECFWDMETSGLSVSAGGTGKTTDQMQIAATFFSWGACGPLWTIDEGHDYPRLAWENIPGEVITGLTYGGGAGTAEDPFLIYTLEQLNMIGLSSCDWNKHFKLMADIDLDPNLPGRKVFDRAVIAPDVNDSEDDFQGTEFTGVFYGNDLTISNMIIEGREYLGLFGLVGEGGQVTNLGLENVTILGGDNSSQLGGLAGQNRGKVAYCHARGNVVAGDGSISFGGLVGFNRRGIITHCYATGHVCGGDAIRFVGGLIGDNNGTVTNCYADSTVTGGYDSRCLGVLAGLNSGRVTHCYSTGSVNSGDSSRSIGGLVGALIGGRDGTVTECYAAASVTTGTESSIRGGLVGSPWDETTISNCYFLAPSDGGGPDNAVGVSLSDEQMRLPASFVGWDFAGQTDGPHDIWAEPTGGGYPILWWQSLSLPVPPFSNGTGEPNEPFLLSTTDELNQIGHNPRFMAAHFSLTEDIDLSGVDFFMIGSELYPFDGLFEGNGHTISNFYCVSTDAGYIGLFGYIEGHTAEIRNLDLTDPNVSAGNGSSVGSLVGYNGGIISNCHVRNGCVAGHSGVGVLAGGNSSFGQDTSRLVSCSATGRVSSNGSAGGLLGYNYGTITDSYSFCSVSGGGLTGGLVGYNFGVICTCYADGSVSGTYMVGGFAGCNYDVVAECFATVAAIGASEVGGVTGVNTGIINNCYATGSVLGDNCVGGLVGRNGQEEYYDFVSCQVVNCYSIGSVSANANVGGLVGYNDETGVILNSFWDAETSERANGSGGTGKTTTEMQDPETFIAAGWDFEDETENGMVDIWWILEGQDYPRLWWENLE